ncbi:MAG: hypothetical protein D8M58_02200 [Calditrichaeota bacterium]|nr:MAG: hypothetical protein DWQ03_04880 [Calditrichota bacterium]MBL1204176.1 hypothetical protein [Calditrichota bacterium]NOG44006.1 hypothetical protein [Calditrichota bacterium]
MSCPILKSVLIKQDKNTTTILLNRPDKKNALNDQLIGDLKEAFNYAKQNDSTKVVILSGTGNAFCSGADLSYMISLRENNFSDNVKDSKSLSDLYLKILNFPKPVIAKVVGPALAGGCGLASVCDFVIADENAIFGYPEVKIGFVAAMVSVFLIKQIGERKARELLLTGKILSASEALECGLINKVIPESQIDKTIEQLIKDLEKNSPKAIQVTKEILSSFQYLENEKEIDRLAEINASFRQTDEFYEGLSAFLEKRKPTWTKI